MFLNKGGLTFTQELARFICSLKYEELPDRVIDKVKCSILDAIACACHGSTTPWGQAMIGFVQELDGPKDSTLWFTDFKGPAVNISLALGTLIHSFDFDDYHNAKLHPSSVAIPVAMTLAERDKSSINAKDFLTALVCGYEIMIRTSLSVNPNASRLKGWHLTGTCGVFGAAATAGKLLGLNEEQMTWALGLAGTQASGLWAFNCDGAMSKRFHPGRASQSGIIAALLAKKGFTGPKYIMEAEDGGFWRATSDKARPEFLLQNLGNKFECEDICIKPYACCASNHSTIDAVHSIIDQHNIEMDNIDEIIVYTNSVTKAQTGFDYLPDNVLQAQMSLKYSAALATRYSFILPEHMSESYYLSSNLRELMKKVSIEIDKQMNQLYPEHFSSKVSIRLTDGNQYECKIIDPLGSNERPLSWDKVMKKGAALLRDKMDEESFDRLARIISDMQLHKNIQPICELLGA